MIKINSIKNGNKWSYDIPIKQITENYVIWLNQSIIVRGRDVNSQYGKKVYLIACLKEILNNGFVINFDPLGNSHKIYVPKIYYFVQEGER